MLRIAAAIAGHPSLWPTALRQVRRTARRRWWARPPFLPLPPAPYLGFRLLTQYGDPRHAPAARDVVNYLRWCAEWDRVG